MNRRAILGAGCILTGAVLLCLYAVPTVYGACMARLAVVQFRGQGADHSLWNSARVLAYQRTLGVSFQPPEAIVRIPRVRIEAPVLEGTSELNLNRGVGHITGTALPGERGNLAIAGHRDGFFRALKDVVPGDVIEVQTAGSRRQTDRYVVRRLSVVSPSEVSVLTPTGDATLTLITCFPFYFVGKAPNRFIVQASLLPASAPQS